MSLQRIFYSLSKSTTRARFVLGDRLTRGGSEGVSALRDALFPAFCRNCASRCGSGVFCAPCSAEIEWLGRCCPRCAMPYPRPAPDAACSSCRKQRLSFDRGLACGVYSGPLRRAVLRLKRQNDPELLAHCAQLLLSRWEREAGEIEAGAPDAVVPVPAHRLRNWIRGRNPALELAREFARRARIPFRQALERKRFICPQSVLSQSVRRRNQAGTFRVVRPAEVPEVALLIDDVVTTGATADAAAGELKRAGSRAVYLLALTRSV